MVCRVPKTIYWYEKLMQSLENTASINIEIEDISWVLMDDARASWDRSSMRVQCAAATELGITVSHVIVSRAAADED